MDVQLCEKCGKIFKAVVDDKFCPACYEELREKRRNAQKYFDDNSEGTLEEASEACNVEKKYVKRWLKDGSIHSTKPLIHCEGCKGLIFTGKLCADCKQRCYEIISK